jgi:hypothetical protein
MLSVFPEALDNKDTLYTAANNAETDAETEPDLQRQVHVVDDKYFGFPTFGLTAGRPARRDNPARRNVVYYGTKTANSFQTSAPGVCR